MANHHEYNMEMEVKEKTLMECCELERKQFGVIEKCKTVIL